MKYRNFEATAPRQLQRGPRSPAPPAPRPLVLAIRRALYLIAMSLALASCNSLGKPEQLRSNLAPACNQREPARDSGDPPAGADVTDWQAWAQAWVAATWAVVDLNNKRAATADCLDDVARIVK